MSLSPASVRSKIPLPRNRSALLGWIVFAVGSVMLYDVYKNPNSGTWPITSIFPW